MGRWLGTLARATAFFHCEGRLTRINLPLKVSIAEIASLIRVASLSKFGSSVQTTNQHGHSFKDAGA